MTKVLYNHNLAPQFMNYGILIPIKGERSLSVFNAIKAMAKVEETTLEQIPLLDRDDLLLAHELEFVNRFMDAQLAKEELIQTYELVDKRGVYCRYDPDTAKESLSAMVPKILRQAGGTYQAMNYALEKSFCFYLGGGMHHAMSGGGRGFCPINDLVIGARKLQQEKKIRKVWVIDIDAHMGDGTAEITKDDPTITTLSIHMSRGWPLDGSDEKFKIYPSDMDIPVAAGEENSYLDKLAMGLSLLKNDYPGADLAIVVDGSDPYEKDELPGTRFLNLTKKQMLDRDMMVYQFLKELNIPQSWVMSGGYGPYSYEIYAQFINKIFSEGLE